MRTSLRVTIAALGLAIFNVCTVVDACASQAQATITPDRVLKGTTPTVRITLDKSITDTNDTRRVRVGGLVVEVNPPTPEGVILVPLPRLDIVGRADVEVIGKDDKPVAALQLTYVAAEEALSVPAVKSPGRGRYVLLYALLIGLLPVVATLYDIQKSYNERATVLEKAASGTRSTEEIRALLTSMDEGPTGLLGLTRGIIAVTLVLVLAFLAIHLVVFAPVNVPDIADKLLMLLAGTLTAITGFYFGSKAASDAAQKTDRSSGPALRAANMKILDVTPASGGPGDKIKLSGRGFGTEAGKVTFGKAQATVDPLDWKDSEILVTLPTGLQSGPMDVVVTTKTGTSQWDKKFTGK